MPGAVDQLRSLLRDCVVPVSGALHGTGFFVAPGLVLTAAHLFTSDSGAVPVQWRGRTYAGSLRYRTPPGRGRLYPPPDLALVELDEPPDHPCVLLDDRAPRYGAELSAAGHASIYEPHARFETRLGYGGEAEAGGCPLMRLTGDEIPPGMSGAPVLDPRTGAVCGVVKTARATATSTAGGVAVPVRALRVLPAAFYRRLWSGHDHYHAGSPWCAVADRLPAAPLLAPAEERRLRLLLHRLPPPADLTGVYRAAAGRFAREPDFPLIHYRDVLSDLGELVPALPGELPAELRFAAEVARRVPDAGRALREWALLVAGRLGLADQAVELLGDGVDKGVRPSILVRLQPTTPRPDRYRLTLWLVTATGQFRQLQHDDAAVARAEVGATLQEHLGRHLADDLLVEIAAPRALVDEDFENLTPSAGRPWSRLGRTHQLVLRDVERLEAQTAGRRWLARWSYLAGRDMGEALRGVDCPDPFDHEVVEGWIEETVERAALSSPCSPDGAAARVLLDVALPAGVPVILWRRGRCTGDETHACDGFLALLRREAAGAALEDLPEVVRRLRNQAAQSRADHCGRRLVLLFDDPGRRPPRRMLVPPEEVRTHD